MEPLRGYDAWKQRAPNPGSVGPGDNKPYQHTKMLWFRAWRVMQRQGDEKAEFWLDQQREIPAFASFVKEVDAYRDRQR